MTGDEISVSEWIYLPSDFNLNLSGFNWYEFFVIFTEYHPGSDHYLRLIIEQLDRTQPVFNLTLGGRRPPHTSYSRGAVNDFNLSRGRWFNVHSYLKRHLTDGAVKVWIDGEMV